MEILKRTALRVLAVLLMAAAAAGVLTATGHLSPGAVDTVTKATGEIIAREDVEGSFVVLINRSVHRDDEVLGEWEKFFRGESYGFIFEDIVCYVASSDTAGMEMAQGLQSRLPENQMEIKTVSSAMIVEKARHGVFDVMVMSTAAIEQLNAQALLEEPDIDVLEI